MRTTITPGTMRVGLALISLVAMVFAGASGLGRGIVGW